MADTNPKDFSTTAASNTTVGGINIDEGSSAAQLNNAIRAVLAVIKSGDWGASGISLDAIAESTAAAGVTIDGLLIKDGGLPGLTLADPNATFSVGDYKPTSRTTADTGWLMADGDTLGSAASAADQASDDYEDLFLHLWGSFDNAQLPVTGGRGASAAADWAANKVIELPRLNNRMPIGAGDTYANGEKGGATTHTLTRAELPNFTLHTVRNGSTSVSGSVGTNESIVEQNNTGGDFSYGLNGSSGEANIGATDPLGSGNAHNNMPPYVGVYWQIKY